jgi:phage terminase large subunit-like protein
MNAEVELRERGVMIKRLLQAHARKREAAKPPRKWFDLARPAQLQPDGDNWSVWLIMAGRGWGKSRTGGEWIVTQVEQSPGAKFGVIGPTWRDTQDVPMAAVLAALTDAGYVRDKDYRYLSSELHIHFPGGASVKGYSAEKPSRIRGANLSGAWCDELCFFQDVGTVWNEALAPAVRIGKNPRILVTTTPRAIPLLKGLIDRDDVVTVRGSTFENAANLSAVALETLKREYEGTRLGRQELYGELLDDAEHALWTRDLIEAATWNRPVPELVRTIVAVDPSGSATGDATGIVTAGVDSQGIIYVLADDTCKGSPEFRYEKVCLAVARHGAGTIVYESAYGGDNIAHGLRSAWRYLTTVGTLPPGPLPMLKVSPTKQSKADRAHPVVALYEQTANGQTRIRHVGALPALEDEMVQWEPPRKADKSGNRGASWSPNRIDALVHAARFLAGTTYQRTRLMSYDALPALPALPIS